MSTTVAKDSVTFTLNKADLKGKNVGDSIQTPKRDVPCSDGLQWWVEWYPAAHKKKDSGCLSVYLVVNKPVRAKYTFAVDNSSISKTSTYEFADFKKNEEELYGFADFATHEILRPLFRNGELTITCSVRFDKIPVKPITIKDSTSFTLFETDLTEKKNGEDLLTPKRDVPNAHGLQWWLQWYPAGKTQDERGYVSVYLWVNKAVKGEFTFSNDRFLTRKGDTHELNYGTFCNGQDKYATHIRLRPLFRKGELTVTCDVEFKFFPEVVPDTFTFTLNETDLTGMKVGQEVVTPKRAVPCSDGLQWWMKYYPAGKTQNNKGHVSMHLWANKPINAVYTVAVDGSFISETCINEFTEHFNGLGYCQLASHEDLRPLFRDGKLTITCKAEFTSSIQSIPATPAVYEVLDHTPPDFDLIIDSKRIRVHKHFLSLISPFYCKQVENGNYRESRTAEITDFDYDAVKTAIDYYYGRELKLLSAKTYVGVLRFAAKMGMKKITVVWEKLILSNLSKVTFWNFLQYADDCKKDALLKECHNYFKANQDEITKNFADKSPKFVVKFLKDVFGLETDDQILRHAHIHDIGFVRDYFDQGYLKDLSIENFSIAANYAWELSRESLQGACAKFFNDNRDMIIINDSFLNLPEKTLRSVLQSAKRKRDGEAEHSAGLSAKRAKVDVTI